MHEPVYVTIGSLPYWIALAVIAIGWVLAFLLCKKKGPKFTFRFVLIMYWADFALHFLKQLMPGYINVFPEYLVRSTAENFCALFVIAAPFMLLSKKKIFYDYLYYMGVISAIAAFLNPSSPAGTDLLTVEGAFEIARYYICHIPILYGGSLLVFTGIHKLDYKRFWITPFLIFVACGICFANCLLANLIFNNFAWETVFYRDNGFMNSAFQVGPGVAFDAVLGSLYPYLCNSIQIYYNSAGELCFTPVLWALPLFYLASPIAFLILCLPFEYKHIRADRLASPYRGRVNS